MHRAGPPNLILLDRDGVINEDSDDFVKSVDEFSVIPGSIAAMANLSQAGFRIAICTNQSGIGRGYFDESTLQQIHQHLDSLVRAAGGVIDMIEHCPHLPDAECDCRKPRPGMLLTIMQRLQAEPTATIFVGDSRRDLEAARAAGCQPVLVRTGNGGATETLLAGLGPIQVFDSLAHFSETRIARYHAAQSLQQ